MVRFGRVGGKGEIISLVWFFVPGEHNKLDSVFRAQVGMTVHAETKKQRDCGQRTDPSSRELVLKERTPPVCLP